MASIKSIHRAQQGIIAAHLSDAKSVVLVAMAYFTNNKLFDLLLKKAQQGLTVQLIIREDEINTSSGIDFEKLNIAGGEFSFIRNLHHKFCVIDGVTVLTGSYNWTNQAEYNHEDLTIIAGDIELTVEYMVQFLKIKDPLRKIRKSIETDNIRKSGNDILAVRRSRRNGVIEKMKERTKKDSNPDKSSNR